MNWNFLNKLANYNVANVKKNECFWLIKLDISRETREDNGSSFSKLESISPRSSFWAEYTIYTLFEVTKQIAIS